MAIKATPASVRRTGEQHAAVKFKARAPATQAMEEDQDAIGDERPIAAVERALSALSAFRAAPRLSLSELSKRTGLFKSTLLRILATLERNGYVVRLADGHYRVGGILFELGSGYVASFQLEEAMKPALAQLVAATGESAAFYVRAGEQRQCVFRVDSPQAVRHVIMAGQILDFDSAATSQILRRYEKGGPRPAAEADYVALCRSTSGQGDVETASVAAPIFDTGGFIGVINVSGPVHRFTKPVAARYLAELAVTASRLSRALGGIGPAEDGSQPS